ncbi:hypothetical protein LOTGIDRAFT_115074 [Lottia gigantea]|uniref:3-oxoacyl-[acyl-carrier-protein] synthase n=1 Tax=Lottia gigantea TaxID=225164 RepID=V4A0U8_LOTGI|nr:hypothetical protein LOTGIDRAFT_115074 [Lottia gigantea]ESO97428.1 hypothetical protein LOTGIDRAFT_115074 [Lottia gigantea]
MVVGSRRVVVTGLGLVTCLGTGVRHVWKNLVNGGCGITNLTSDDFQTIPSKVVGIVPKGLNEGQLNLEQFLTPAELRGLPLPSAYALVAAEEALDMARWKPNSEEEKYRSGVIVGTGMVPLDEICNVGQVLREKGYKRVTPHFIPNILPNMSAGHVSIKFGLKGPNHTPSTACTTGLHAIGDAFRMIQYGDADVMVAGGTESSVSPLAMAGFCRMRALCTNFNDRPKESSRPFDRDRNGFVMSEGCGILVLESLEHALERQVPIYAEIMGYGLSGDAHHISAPCEDGEGALRCMKSALKHSNIEPSHVGYINAHATSTYLGDIAESKAIEKLFNSQNKDVFVSSTKGAIGHLLGAAGSVEAIFTILSCKTGIIPPTLNLHNVDTGCDLNYVRTNSEKWTSNFDKKIALTNSFGFGGTNGSLCVSEFLP